ncbi:MAG TPA: hypothetical protein VKC64_09335 [Burkholderiales bacterium]|nr:hypothetical protein [Burkholderiales bacterium]
MRPEQARDRPRAAPTSSLVGAALSRELASRRGAAGDQLDLQRRGDMTKRWAFAFFLALVAPFAAADDSLVRFKGGIGVIPVSSGVAIPPTLPTAATVESVNRNIVRTVQPPGQIWVIADLRADVKTDGRIKVRGRGLLLGGGNNIGTNAGQSVFATLICEAAAPFTLRNTATSGVPLDANGDFRIDDVLAPTPGDCASPVLLIRNLGGAWFAAGIVNRRNDDD